MMPDQTRNFLFARDKAVCLMASNGKFRPQIEKTIHEADLIIFHLFIQRNRKKHCGSYDLMHNCN